MMTGKISFGSDNEAGVSPEIMDYLVEVNRGHDAGYGDDPITAKAKDLFEQEFGKDIKVFFLYNGTGSNTLSLGAMTRSYNSIICSDISHIIIHEVTGPQTFTGCRFICLPHKNGKIQVEQIRAAYEENVYWGIHTALPKVVSITQPTELGTLYEYDEIRSIADFCHRHDMLLHMDGARISNACVALNSSFGEITRECGVDVLSFGATKNGLMFGDAVVFFNRDLAHHFEYRQKQGLQLHSKMRFITAQYIPYFEKKLWKKNAAHANTMCSKIAKHLESNLPDCLAYPVVTNQLFARISGKLAEALRQYFYFYTFDPRENIVRFVASFDTSEKDIEQFGRILQEEAKKNS